MFCVLERHLTQAQWSLSTVRGAEIGILRTFVTDCHVLFCLILMSCFCGPNFVEVNKGQEELVNAAKQSQ